MNDYDDFFSSIFSEIKFNIDTLIIVTHLVPGTETFLLTLNKYIKISAVIPKPNSITEDVMEKISKEIPILNHTRKTIKNKKIFLHDLNKLINKKICRHRYRRLFFSCFIRPK